MGKKIEKEKNELVEEFFKKNDPKNIKSMSDMYTAWKDFFAPAFQQLIDAEILNLILYLDATGDYHEKYKSETYNIRR